MWTLTWRFCNISSSVFISRVLILYNLLGPYWLSHNKGDFWLIAVDTGYLLTNIRHLIVDSLFCMVLNLRWLLFLSAILTRIMHSKNLHTSQFLHFWVNCIFIFNKKLYYSGKVCSPSDKKMIHFSCCNGSSIIMYIYVYQHISVKKCVQDIGKSLIDTHRSS